MREARDFGLALEPSVHRRSLRIVGALRLILRGRFLRIDAERGECGLGGDERHPAALFVVPPDGVIALGADLLDQALVEQALEDVAGGIALEPGGDGEDAAIGSLAGGGQNDELRIGQLRHGFAP